MAFFIRPKRSNVAGRVPGQEGSASSFSKIGEIAINMRDQVIYVKTPDSDLDSDLGHFGKGVKVIGRTYTGANNIEVDTSAGRVRFVDEPTFRKITISSDSDQRVFSADEAVTKRYVDSVGMSGGLNIHEPVEVAWDSDINTFIAGSQSVTNLNLNENDRVLVTGPAGANNEYGQPYAGIYTYDTSLSPIQLRRADDFRNDSESVIDAGEFVFVRRGTFGGTSFVVLNSVPVDATQDAQPDDRFPEDPNTSFGTATNISFGVFRGAGQTTTFNVGADGVTTASTAINFSGSAVASVSTSNSITTVVLDNPEDSDWFMGDSLQDYQAVNNPFDIVSRGATTTTDSDGSGNIQTVGNIVIGANARSDALNGSVVIGDSARVDQNESFAIGVRARASGVRSGAIGVDAVATQDYEIRLGGPNSDSDSDIQFVSVNLGNFTRGTFEDTINRDDMLVTKGYVDRELGSVQTIQGLRDVLANNVEFDTPRLLIKPANNLNFIEAPLTIQAGELGVGEISIDSDDYTTFFVASTSNTHIGRRSTDRTSQNVIEQAVYLGPADQFDTIDSDFNDEVIDSNIPNIYTQAPQRGGAFAPIPLDVTTADSEQSYPIYPTNSNELETVVYAGQVVNVEVGGAIAMDSRLSAGRFFQFGVQRFNNSTQQWELLNDSDGSAARTSPIFFRPLEGTAQIADSEGYRNDVLGVYTDSDTRFQEVVGVYNRNGLPFSFTFTSTETTSVRLRLVGRVSATNASPWILPEFTSQIVPGNNNITTSGNSAMLNHFHGSGYAYHANAAARYAAQVAAGTRVVDSDSAFDNMFPTQDTAGAVNDITCDSDFADHGIRLDGTVNPFGAANGANSNFTLSGDVIDAAGYSTLNLGSTEVQVMPSFDLNRMHNLNWGRGKTATQWSHNILGTMRFNNVNADANLMYDSRYMQGVGSPNRLVTDDSDRTWYIDLPANATVRPSLTFSWLQAQRGSGATGRGTRVQIEYSTDVDSDTGRRLTTGNWVNMIDVNCGYQDNFASFRTTIDPANPNHYGVNSPVLGTTYTNQSGEVQRVYFRQTLRAVGGSTSALINSYFNGDSEINYPINNFNVVNLQIQYPNINAVATNAGITPLSTTVSSNNTSSLFQRQDLLPPDVDSDGGQIVVQHISNTGRYTQLFDFVWGNAAQTNRTVQILTDGTESAVQNGYTYIVRIRNNGSTIPAGSTVNFAFLNNGIGGAQTAYFDPLNRGATVLISPHVDGGNANAGNLIQSSTQKDIVFRIHVYDSASNDVVIVRES